GAGGAAVLDGLAQVREASGVDVSAAFVEGARQALALVRERGIRVAVLKEGSPSCGSGYTYDGSFSGARIAREGVTAACLTRAGVRVFSEHELDAAQAWLRQLETGA
ncbi:DUF523 domain-containing protein, partial [Bordetella bronchiseptica]